MASAQSCASTAEAFFAKANRCAQQQTCDLPPPTEPDAQPYVAAPPPPPGFELRRGLRQTMIQTDASEKAECAAYLEADQKWWDTEYKEWQAWVQERRTWHHELKLLSRRARLPEPPPLEPPPEPRVVVPRPACIQRRIDELNALPVARRASVCRESGGQGHDALHIARAIVLREQRPLFLEADRANLRARREAKAAAQALAREKKDVIGPNGETSDKWEWVTEKQKCGGGGQLIDVPVLKRKRAADDEFQ